VEREPHLDEETIVAWFYRVLRNAIVDRYRHVTARQKALEKLAEEMEPAPSREVQGEVCACVKGLLPTLKAIHADVLEYVDVNGGKLVEYARDRKRNENAMRVRLHRARDELRKSVERTCKACAVHGCLDCDCK
jgi:DNA-directed RNA polymerase specialized sigma24 family protein